MDGNLPSDNNDLSETESGLSVSDCIEGVVRLRTAKQTCIETRRLLSRQRFLINLTLNLRNPIPPFSDQERSRLVTRFILLNQDIHDLRNMERNINNEILGLASQIFNSRR
jgi:hypothetical protein